MLVLLVTVRVKPEHLAEFLAAARHNAEHAVADEPGCLAITLEIAGKGRRAIVEPGRDWQGRWP